MNYPPKEENLTEDVTLNVTLNDTINVTLFEHLPLPEKEILNIIEKDKYIKIEEIAKNVNKSVRTVKRYLLSLSKKGIVTRAVSKKTGYWNVNK